MIMVSDRMGSSDLGSGVVVIGNRVTTLVVDSTTTALVIGFWVTMLVVVSGATMLVVVSEVTMLVVTTGVFRIAVVSLVDVLVPGATTAEAGMTIGSEIDVICISVGSSAIDVSFCSVSFNESNWTLSFTSTSIEVVASNLRPDTRFSVMFTISTSEGVIPRKFDIVAMNAVCIMAENSERDTFRTTINCTSMIATGFGVVVVDSEGFGVVVLASVVEVFVVDSGGFGVVVVDSGRVHTTPPMSMYPSLHLQSSYETLPATDDELTGQKVAVPL